MPLYKQNIKKNHSYQTNQIILGGWVSFQVLQLVEHMYVHIPCSK